MTSDAPTDFGSSSCSKSSAHHSAFASARLMALRRLVAGRALDFEQISKEDYQKISKVSLAFENKWKLLGMGQSKEKVKYAFFSLRLLLTWLGCVWWSCQIDFSSCQMEKKRHSLFANMTEHSRAYDIVSGGDGVVAVSWLLACNLSFHFLFKCLVKSRYWYGT